MKIILDKGIDDVEKGRELPLEEAFKVVEEMMESREQEPIIDEECPELTRDMIIKREMIRVPRGYRTGEKFHSDYHKLVQYARSQGKSILKLSDEELTQFITPEAINEMRDSYERINTLTYKNYHGTVEYSQEEDCFYGKVKNIKSLLSYEGDSVDELEEDFHSVIDEYLADCEEVGVIPE